MEMSWITGVILVSIVLIRSELSTQKRTLMQLNKKLDLMLNHFELQPQNGPLLEQCRQLAASSGKIEAIKFYREKSGVGLKEAKDVIDNL